MQAPETVKSSRVIPGGQIPNMVYAGLVRMLGRADAEAVDLYVDTRLAVVDPDRYEQSIALLLGEHGGRLVIEGIKTELARRTSTERSRESLLCQVKAAETALPRSPLP